MSNQEAKQQAQFKQILERMLQEPHNKWCADCRASAPRWASSKLGVFLCIKCAGIHRSMGTHISFVRSVNLDKWKDTEIQAMQEFGNRRAALIWEASLPEGFRRPSANDGYPLEKFIRAKYVSKQFYQHKTKEQLDKYEELNPASQEASAPVQQVPEQQQQQQHQQQAGRLSGSSARRPVKKPAGYLFTPPSSPPPQSPPATDFGHFQRAPPPVNILSTAVNLLSLEADDSEFGSFTPPSVPKSQTHSTSVQAPVQAPAPVQTTAPAPAPAPTPAPAQTSTAQSTKDSIMGLFEPAPTAYSGYGYPQQQYQYSNSPQAYHSPTGTGGYYTQQTAYYSPQVASPAQTHYYPQQVASPSWSSPVASPTQTHWAPQQVASQNQWPAPQQSAYSNGAAFDPLLHRINAISAEKRDDSSAGSGLATLLF
eukprot:TRINITY_DN2341_c0_g1_i1.p1 TRINITY_DN2341_c0_g1~~TRINITY_DN2341_c0_g1_i1.p1  ORF type:complete len:424 (+),score=94.96 TRINITY_DN2341_c0_g1_i1:44-1315(+)